MLTPFIRTAGMSTAGRLTPKISITGPLAMPRSMATSRSKTVKSGLSIRVSSSTG